MNEVRFACPVCGQHITADSSASGSHLECPSCFRKIVVPQAPASPDSKLILSATEVDPRRPSTGEAPRPRKHQVRRPFFATSVAAFLVLLIAGALATYFYRDRLFLTENQPPPATNAPPEVPDEWTLDLARAPFPETKVTGRILGVRFTCERTTLQGGTLTFYQNPDLPSERRVTVRLFAHRPERLMDSAFEIPHDRVGPRPRLTLEVKHAAEPAMEQTFQDNYALRLAFETIEEDLLPGRIYLAIGDEEKSFITGRFEAEVLRNPRPKRPERTNAVSRP
jgi:hypothetical protein